MVSLRQIAYCIGLTDGFRVLEDFFGYSSIPSNAPHGGLSLRTQIERLRYSHIDLNLIRVGIEGFSQADEEKIDYAVQFTRDTYATVDVGIARVQRWIITRAEAHGLENIHSNDDAEALTREWTVPNNGLDVFFVLTYFSPYTGYSWIDGPCDKDAGRMNGSVLQIDGSLDAVAKTLAHEIGHYLGLEHSPDWGNLMYATLDGNQGHLTNVQAAIMRGHCFVGGPCSE